MDFPKGLSDFQQLKHTEAEKWGIYKENRNELAKDLIKSEKYDIINADYNTFKNDVHRLIFNEFPLTLNEAQQNKHILSSLDFDPKRSTLTVDPLELIDLYAGKSNPIRVKSGNWKQRERFTHTNEIGIYRDIKGFEAPTNNGVIHYTRSNGAHIVPAKP